MKSETEKMMRENKIRCVHCEKRFEVTAVHDYDKGTPMAGCPWCGLMTPIQEEVSAD